MMFLRYIVLFPLAGVLINLCFGRWLGRRGAVWVGCLALFMAFLSTCGNAWLLLTKTPPDAMVIFDGYDGTYNTGLFTWLSTGRVFVPFTLLMDPLSMVMCLVITGVGFLIHVYSAGYMAHDASIRRFFIYLNLFVFFMLILVLADSLPLMFVGWEGVGLCSYLLIGFWHEDMKNAAAGKKAFVVNRIGDAGFILGMLLLLSVTGSLNFADINSFNIGLDDPQNLAIMTLAALLLFVGACGKSAQIPLYVWLPDAMAGPTPVSALIHAATMVTAGVYMVARLHGLYTYAPAASAVVAIVGAATAVFAAIIGLAQKDIKKVLAYSTVSQLGYMFLAVGVGAYTAGIFHLTTHAFFKALLFLGAGSVIHAMSGEQNIMKMGGIFKSVPVTGATFVIAVLAIAGIPPLAGYFSKDAILLAAYHSHPVIGSGPALAAFGLFGALLTAFYMGRVTMLTFFGTSRVDAHAREHLHESPKSMTVPLAILAGLSIAGGMVLAHPFDELLGKVFGPHADHHHGAASMHVALLATLAGVAGLTASFIIYNGRRAPELMSRIAGPLHQLVENKFYVDELFDAVLVRLVYALSVVSDLFDRHVIDRAVNVTGGATRLTGFLASFAQSGSVSTYILFMLIGLGLLLSMMKVFAHV